jgi:hypothetical protein
VGRTTNRQRRDKQAVTAREKAAAARAEQRRQEQRRRGIVILSSVVAVAVVAAAIAVVAITHKSSKKNNVTGDRTTATAAVVSAVTSVSDASLEKVGAGTVNVIPTKVTGEPALASGGEPELLYIGAEFCPYCAVERWSLAIALSKFGTLSNLGMVHSAADDGNYASLDFLNTTYTSKYLTFTSVENEDRNHATLQKLTTAQNALWNKLDNNSPGFPFISFGNKVAFTTSAPLDPSVLGTLTQAQIASQLNDPSSAVAKTILGGANVDIAAICLMTGNKPASVCSSTAVTNYQTKINA